MANPQHHVQRTSLTFTRVLAKVSHPKAPCKAKKASNLGQACFTFRNLVGRFARIDSRFARASRIFSANRFSLREKRPFFANRPSRKWIAARIGRESREFECESERRRDSRESGQVLQKYVFSCESIRANLRKLVCESPAH